MCSNPDCAHQLVMPVYEDEDDESSMLLCPNDHDEVPEDLEELEEEEGVRYFKCPACELELILPRKVAY